MSQLLAHRRPSFAGGIHKGLHHGAHRVAYYWGLMVIGFVGGTMDLLWTGGATRRMTLEKLSDIGRWLTRPLGARPMIRVIAAIAS